jgi:hypothetical protein
MALDWTAVSQRIKGLISMSDQAQLPEAAARLGVEERVLRDALKQQSRLSTLKVIGAVVRVYGLDPSWVLTGKYDPATHRVAIQNDSSAIDDLLKRLITDAGLADSTDAQVQLG